jgi:bifunctional non-homologous end joining protein LigD
MVNRTTRSGGSRRRKGASATPSPRQPAAVLDGSKGKGESSLRKYRAMRRFDATPEPKGVKPKRQGWSYVIQKHDATRLHYDFRLELDGVLKSWAVTRGPSLDPKQKRLAIRTEDHPLDYGGFEGIIPEGNYGAGTVMLWDRGSWEPVGDPHEGLKRGKLVFNLDGKRLKGGWALVRMRGKGERQEPWLLVKEADEIADPRRDVLAEFDTSVESKRDLDAIAGDKRSRTHGSNRGSNRDAPRQRSRGTERIRRVRAAKLPGFVEPTLATLVDEAPGGKDWLFEIKFDGYRALAAASGETVRLHTRSGLDWTGKFGDLQRAVAALDLDGALIDGEVVALDAQGRSGFSQLQKALSDGGKGLSYFAFDLLHEGGKDLRKLPLAERKARLKQLLGAAGSKGPVFYSDHVRGDGNAMLAALCRKGFEGVIAKRADRPYESGRSRHWLKVKCNLEQEFVIIGHTRSDKDRPFASILIAAHDKARDRKRLRYVGGVGTGFDRATLADLDRRFRKLARATPAAEGPFPPALRRTARWIEPKLVAQIGFTGFTDDGIVRHGRYLGLREDKPAREIGIEQPEPLRAALR